MVLPTENILTQVRRRRELGEIKAIAGRTCTNCNICTCILPVCVDKVDYLDIAKFRETYLVCPQHPYRTTTIKMFVCGLDLEEETEVQISTIMKHIDVPFITYESFCFTRNFMCTMRRIGRKTPYHWHHQIFRQNIPIIINWNFHKSMTDYFRIRDFVEALVYDLFDEQPEQPIVRVNVRLNRTYAYYAEHGIALDTTSAKFGLFMIQMSAVVSSDSFQWLFGRNIMDHFHMFFLDIRVLYIDGAFFEDSIEPVVFLPSNLLDGTRERQFVWDLFLLFDVTPFDALNYTRIEGVMPLLRHLASTFPTETYDDFDYDAPPLEVSSYDSSDEGENASILLSAYGDDVVVEPNIIGLTDAQIAQFMDDLTIDVDEQCEKRVVYEPRGYVIVAGAIVIALLGFALGVNLMMHIINGNIDNPDYTNFIPPDDCTDEHWKAYTEYSKKFADLVVPTYGEIGKFEAVVSLIADMAITMRVIRLGDFWASVGVVHMFLSKDDRPLILKGFASWLSMTGDRRASDMLVVHPNSNSAAVGTGFAARSAVKKHVILTGGNPRTKRKLLKRLPHNLHPEEEEDYHDAVAPESSDDEGEAFEPAVEPGSEEHIENDAIHVDEQNNVENVVDLAGRFASAGYKLIFNLLGFTISEEMMDKLTKASGIWSQSKDLADVTKEIWTTLWKICDMFRDFVATGDYRVFLGKDTDLVLAEASFLLESDKYIRTFPRSEPELTYDSRIERATACVASLRKLKFKDTPASIIYKLITELNEKIVTDKRILSGASNHHRPMCVYMFGDTSTGKTNLCNDLNEIAISVCGRDTTASNTLFLKNANDDTDFIEGRDFNPSCVVTAVIDEIGSQQPKPGVKFPFRFLFDAVQDGGWLVNRAFEKSNNVMYNNLLVLLSNSSSIYNLDYWVNNGDAAINRIDYSIHVEWKNTHKPPPNAPRGAGYEEPDNNRIYTIGKHMFDHNSNSYQFVPFSNENGPTHRFTTGTAFKNWFRAALDSQYQNGSLFSKTMDEYRRHPRCAANEIWLIHGAPCCTECNWAPPPKAKIDNGWRLVPHPEGAYVVKKEDVRDTAYNMEERPYFRPAEQSGVEVPYWMIILSFFVGLYYFSYFPTKEWFILKGEEIVNEIMMRVFYRTPKKRAFRLAQFVKDKVLRLDERQRRFLGVLTILTNLAIIYGCSRPIKKTVQMDAKFRAAAWPCNEDRPDWYIPPPDPTKQEWGMKKLVYTPERIIGNKINAIQSNMVAVVTEIGKCWGVFIRPNVILTTAHNVPKLPAVALNIGGRSMILGANDFSFHPTKDFVLIQSPDVRANTTLLFERAIVRETRKQYCKGKLILKNNVYDVNWRPTEHMILANTHNPGMDVHFQKEYETINGDCGGVAINEAGEIFGIHEYSGGGVRNIELPDISVMLKGLPTGELESGGMVVTKKTMSVLSQSQPPSAMNPFKADPLTIPIAKLPESVMMHNNFETEKALAHEYFVSDLIETAGEDFACPDSRRKLDPKLGFKARGEERALIEMNNKGAVVSVLHARLAMDYLIKELRTEPKWTFLCPMTPCELAKHLKGSTSAGYPWKSTKNGLLDAEKYFPEEYEEEIVEILSIATNDVVVGFSSMALKDEARKQSKVDIGDIRIFEVLGTVNTAGACLVVPLILEMRNHPKFGFMVGLNCVSKEWGNMYNDLARRGLDRAFFLDGKKYDKHMSLIITREVARFTAEVAKLCGYSAMNIKRVYNIVMSACVRLLRVFGEVALVTEGNPSGSFMTTMYNMIAMLIFLVSTFQQHYPDKDYFSEVTNKLYGDDSLGTVNEGNELFNQIAIRDHAALFFGQEFTSGRKDGNLIPYENLNEGVFLKRSFNFRNGLILCPLEKSSIFKMLCWRTPSRGSPLTKEEHFVAVAQNALKEAFLHSRDFYDYILAKINVVKACHNLAFDVPTYDEIDALYEKDELVVWDA